LQKATSHTFNKTRTFELIVSAMCIALVFVATMMLNIKLPIAANGGLVHLGTAMLLIVSILFGPKTGAIAGALGMGLFDLVSGWTLWAPITFISRGLQGYIAGKVAWSKGYKGKHIAINILATIVSMPPMIAVYYIGEGILYSNWIQPMASIPGDLVQNILGLAISIPVCAFLKKINAFK
jgi:uncharacterized membrane protein